DIGNGRIREITTAGIINTIAGNGNYGFSGDGGQATNASFKDPTGISLDDTGNIFVTDVFNNRVRKINTSGVITTIAGNGIAGFSGDGGQATLASLYYPTGIAIDDSGNVYIADEDNNRIRKVNTKGIITTVAGNGTASYAGDGGPAVLAEINFPGGVTVDKSYNIYIADASNNRIRMVGPEGIISTIAGNGAANFSGDDGFALAAALYNPTAISVDASGNLVVADAFNFRVRKLTKLARNINFNDTLITIYPNPNHGVFNIALQNAAGDETIEIYNVLGEKLFYTNLNQNGLTEINLSRQNSGFYLYRVLRKDKSVKFNGKIVIL
ncbi:MAG TPA: T9SS type A sorting domain-containing protein, partial [Bacteroidia bacterium]|nr:T9SS type A sorting domain-containing protein [Bacteroidia bacterium]